MDVHVDAYHPGGLSGLIAEDAGGLQEPAHFAILAHHAPGVAYRVLGAVDAGVEMVAGALPVLRVQAGQPLVAGQGLLVGSKPHHDGQLGRPEDAAAAQVYVKHADLARFLRQLQALVDFAQRSLGLAGLGHVLDHPQRGIGKALHLQPTPGQPGVENTAIGAGQHGRITHRFMRVQAWHDFGAERLERRLSTKQERRMAPLQLRRALTHQLSKRRVELAQVPIANQHDGRGVVEDGGLLLQQFVEHALAALQLCLGAHALRHFLMQAHDGNAFATLIKNGRQGNFVVVQASIAPLVDEGAAPRLA